MKSIIFNFDALHEATKPKPRFIQDTDEVLRCIEQFLDRLIREEGEQLISEEYDKTDIATAHLLGERVVERMVNEGYCLTDCHYTLVEGSAPGLVTVRAHCMTTGSWPEDLV